MNISFIADFADVLAALGVIASLLFVAFQVRQNTSTVRNQHYESILGRLADGFSRPLDGQVAETLDKGRRNFEDLTAPEKLIFDAWANEYVMSIFNVATLSRQGLVDPGIAAMVDRRIKAYQMVLQISGH